MVRPPMGTGDQTGLRLSRARFWNGIVLSSVCQKRTTLQNKIKRLGIEKKEHAR